MLRVFLCAFALTLGLCSTAFAQAEETDFRVRDGYQVTIASEPMEETRFMEFDDEGTLYVSSPNQGEIKTLRDTDGDGVYEIIATYVSDYPRVHGMHFYDGWLWFAQSGAIHRGQDTDGDGVADDVVTVVPEGELDSGGGHWWRPIFVTDEGFYTSIGCDGNITEDLGTGRMILWFYSLDGSEKRKVASGIRNTEKYRYRPGTTELWGMDHNSDWYGRELGEDRDLQPITDAQPPEEFNLYVDGGFYGHPYIVGNKLPRLEYYDREDIIQLADETIPPEYELPAHAAANGWCFLDDTAHFPASFQGDAFIACHGSWNRSIRTGYSIIRILFDDQTGKPYGHLRIVSTLTSDNIPAGDNDGVLGRPVDCVVAPDGTILFSCDWTHQIYRIAYTGGETEGME